MASFKASESKLGGAADLFGRSRPRVYRYVFGEGGEFGSVTFRRDGDRAEVLELVEPEHGDEPAGPASEQSAVSVSEEPAGDDGADVAG